MKKIIIAIISALLSAILLVGCTPANTVVPEKTDKPILGPTIPGNDGDITIESYVVRSPNYYFDSGEYYYFYATFLSEFVSAMTDEQLEKLDLKVDTAKGESLRDKKHPDGGTWFEFFRDLTLEYMQDILLVCEVAILENPYITNDSQLYFDQQIKAPLTQQAKLDESIGTFENLILSIYGGAVSATEYSNAIQKQYIYDVYYNEKYAEIEKKLTDAEIEAFASSSEFSGEKDESLSRNIGYIEVELGDATYNQSIAQGYIAQFSGGERTIEAFESLAETEKLPFGRVENITAESSSAAVKWLFEEGRKLGDSGVIKLEDGSAVAIMVFYYADGKPTYLLDAADELAQKRLEEHVDSLAADTKLDVDNEKLNAIKA